MPVARELLSSPRKWAIIPVINRDTPDNRDTFDCEYKFHASKSS